jgi:hypothetical protein
MKSKIRVTLLLVVLFVIAMTTAFAQTRAFDDSHIAVTIENAGPGGVVVIGSTVKVTLTDPEYSPGSDPPNEIESASVNFSQFGGPATVAMTWDAILLKWKADYLVVPGAINTTTAKVIVTGNFFSGGSSIIPDDQLFTVNNIAGTLGPLDIVTTVTDAGANGTAIVGSTITVTFTSAVVSSASVNFASFGGGVVPMVKAGNTFLATYVVVPGTNYGSYKVQIIAFEGANPNPGTALDNDFTAINNVLPSATDILASHLQVNNLPNLAFLKIGDTIHVMGTFKTTGATVVNKVWINWGSAFTGAPVMDYVVINGVLDATYQPASGSLSNTANLTIAITKMQTAAGNVATGIWNVSLNGATPPVAIEADLMAPSIVGVRDLFYDTTKPLRFSPVVAPVDGYDTIPNTFDIYLTIPNWGTADGVKSFTLKFTSENRQEFFRTYSFSDAPATVVAVGGDLKVAWDGKDNNGTVVAQAAQTTFGITLWELKDGVGNAATLSHVLGNEFSPTGAYDVTTHHNIYTAGDDAWVGSTYLNRIHVVADNTPLTKSTDFQPLGYTSFTPAAPIHLVRLIDDRDNDNAYTAGEAVYYRDAAGATVSTLDFKFQLTRDYTVDSNPLRHETGRYWAVIESGASKWFYDGAAWQTYPAIFDHVANSIEVPFAGANTVSNLMNLSWNTSNIATFPGAVTTGTPYKVYAYFMDNAGNIVKSQEVNVKIEHRYYHIPIISDVTVISQHDNGGSGLPVTTLGVENFYVTSAYTPGGDYTGNYYVSQDTVRVELLINDMDYLRDNQAVKIQNNLGGTIPSTIWLNKSAFVNNPNALLPDRAVIEFVVNNMSSASGAVAPGKQWTIGGAAGPANYIKVEAYPLTVNPFITSYEATGSDVFNLVRPEEPVWPTTDIADYALTATPEVFSPGNPINTYDAVTNPANDNAADETNFNFTIPYSNRNVTWTLKLERQAGALLKSWTGSLTPAQLPYTPATPFNFNGLLDNLSLVTPATATEALNLKLVVQPAPYEDPGYSTPPTAVTPSKVVTVDNTNPILATGANSSFSADKVITLLPAQPTPVVTEVQNQISFTLHTNEALSNAILNGLDPIADPLKGTGWNIQVLDSLGVALMNGANPVTATINSVVASNDNKTFAITATLNNLAGDFTAEKAKLHIRLPWDSAKNPARYNNPSYPYNADVYNNDSAEGFLTIHILNAKPRITNITFTNKTITGTASYVGGNWNPATTQAWVRDGGSTPPLGSFTMVATVEGGAYRAMHTDWTANLQTLLGGTGAQNTAVVPTSAVSGAGPNESLVWTLTWTGVIPASVANAWTNNQTLSIPITIITRNGSNPIAHTETKNIDIMVDKAAPVASTSVSSLTADGTAKALNFTVTDTPGSGVYWDTIVGNPYGYVGESLVLNPNTGMTVTDTGNGTFNVTIPTNTAVKYVQATYTVSDHMGNQVVYNRYINIVPVPQLSNVKINTDATWFVPGNNLTVTWDLANYQRATGVVVTLTAPGVTLTSYTQTITTGFAATMSYTFTNFFQNNTNLDGKVLTATVTGYTTGYTSPTASTTGNIPFTYSGNSDVINVDTKPVISSVVFKYNGVATNVITPDMTGVQIVATVTSTDIANTAAFPMTITMSGVTGNFNLPAPTVTQSTTGGVLTRTYTWDNVSFAGLTWTPASDYKVANFVFNCQTDRGYAAAPYTHQVAVLSNPTSLIQGIVASRTPYAGTDPDGWFAPEHLLSTQYTFISTVNNTNPPITADFDLIEDNIVQNLQAPIPVGQTNGSTKTTLTIPLTQGGANVNATAYKYVAKWRTQPDVQSVWNAYDDGQAVPIYFAYQQLTGSIADTRSIKVDKKVPVYDTDQLWVATGTSAPADWTTYFVNNGFHQQINLALTTNGQWPTSPSTQKIYLKYLAKDGVTGVGVIDVATPALTGWTVAQVSHTELAQGVVEKVISLTPTNPGAINATTVINLTLALIQDKVGHVNYGIPVNSTDPAWTANGPVLTFGFSSNYLQNTEFLTAYQYVNGNRLDDYTAPYVRKGANFGFKMKLAAPPRGVDVSNIAVSGIDLNTYYVTNASGTGTTWTALTPDVDGTYYLNTNIPVSSSYANGAAIKLQYRVNYTITYTDGTNSTTSYVSQEISNKAYVDAVSPVITSVQIWSESLGISQEGYVVPFDQNGTLEIKVTEIGGYLNPTTVPVLSVTNLNQFVASRNGIPMISPYVVPAADFSFANGVWTATINNLVITSPVPPTTSVTIAYSVTDPVGNAPHAGNRMVEVATNGPIVPIIRDAELITTLPDGQTVRNYLAQGVPAVLKVYIDTQYQAYIEQVWANAVTGVSYGTPTIVEDTDPLNNYRWIATIPVTPTTVNNYQTINFVVNTKRNPFGGDVFQDTHTVPVIVDGNNFIIANPIVKGVSAYMTIPGMINPAVAAVVTADFNLIGEQIATGTPGDPAVLPNNAALAAWFTLQNTNPVAFTNIPAPVVTGTGNNRTATWTFAPADINQNLAANVTQLAINFKYKNIYGLEKTSSNVNFNVDRGQPVISANGIKFYTGTTVTQTNSYNATNYIANNQDWTKVRFELNDPLLRAGVDGSGLNNAMVTLTRAPETYAPNPDPLNNVIVTPLANGYIELQFTNGFSAYDLAEGYYNFTITVEDNLENEGTYIQQLLYWHSPSQIVVNPAMNSNINVMNADGSVHQQQITAFPADPNGQVQGVHFHLYQDVNNNSSYQAAIDTDRTLDITPADSNPDMQAPYTVMWDMSAAHYKYLVDPVYGRNPLRKFLVRASAISEGRSVTDTIVVVNVRDNQPPIPNVPIVSGNTTFDYNTPANNVLTLSTGFAAEWSDAEWAIFEIYKNGTLITTLNALYSAGVADTTWSYNGQTPGEFTVTVKGKDFVGNISSPINMATPVTINNPASLISYNLGMTNVLGFNNEPVIPNNTVYGFNNPASAVGNLRLDANFYNINTMLPSLEGISSVTFKARVTNNVTGAVSTVNVPNDIVLQPDYPASGPIAVTPQMVNNFVTIFVPDSFYMPAGYEANDFSYEFFIELTPTNPALLQNAVYRTIRLDYFAPRVAITENTPNITWSRNNLFKVTGDITDINSVVLKWSSDNVSFQDAVYGNLVFNTQPNTTHYAQFENWNTAGGSVQTLLNYAGSAWLKVVATDALGNVRESAPVQVFVDNVAPNTPVTHVAYRSNPDTESHENAGAYANLHTLGSLYGETGNTITAVSSTQDYGTSALRIYVDPAQITNLSTVALGDANFNTNASWYTGTNDFRPPVRLYHGYSATGDINNITWTNGVLYDHEPLNGLYGFDIPANLFQASGTHYFILGSSDTRGNVEGDFANNGIPTALAFDGALSADEKKAAIDLIVNVINVADVKAEIVSHVDNQIVGEWINLAANITDNAGNVPVDQVLFQYKVNNTWTDLATVSSAASSNVKFHLYRKDIPAYDGLPFVPGVHLYANGSQVSEMVWNATHECWEYTANLNQGAYNFEYRLDLNNDGVISSLDLDVANMLGSVYIIQDPNGFTNFNVTPWVTPLNTETIAAGIYEFRALPLASNGSVLFNQVAPSRWIHIDNNAPNTSITVIGGVQRIRPLVDPVTIVADVNELLVATDDIVEVMYQYSSQPAAAPVRRWVQFGTQVNMGGNYRQIWTALAPLTDLVDNDNDGLVDEADEADATYYLRAVARDKAGNYFTSNIYTMFVDGSAPQMLVDYINGVHMNATNNIFVIPATGDVTVTTNNITAANFDNPTMVHFEYSYKASVNAPAWSGWQHFDVNNQWIPVNAGTASQILPYVAEGYYRIRATAKDALGNIDANAPITYVIFDDQLGSNAHITMVGTRPIVSGQYAFAQAMANYNGNIQATIDNPSDVNTLTFEWATSVTGPWMNINTIATGGMANIATNWNPPVLGRAPYLYLRVVAQDVNGNNQSEQIVKLYLDATAPGAVVNQLTHSVADGIKWLDNSAAVALNVSYTNLPELNLVDVAAATVRIVNVATGLTINEAYTNVNEASVNFTFSASDMATLTDGIYRLEIQLTDFAGNNATILPADYQALYIDTQAPAGLAMVSPSHPNYIAVYSDNAINFEITYNDLIGIAPTGDMTATFTYQNVSQTISTYNLDTVNNKISFTWDPSTAFEQFIINGEMNILVSADVKVKDLLDNEATVPNTANFFTLTYGIPGVTRLMAVTDVVNGNPTLHYVNWNMPTPQVVEMVGTNHTANAQPLDLYAYVPHLSEIPTSVDFSYRLLGTTTWNPIATDINGEMWNFIDPSFLAQYQRQYSVSWDIASLIGGVYEVQITSHYPVNNSTSVAIVNIYNSTIVPQVAVPSMLNGTVQRGETYAVTAPTFTGNVDFLSQVSYKYRYVNVANNVVSPVSQWMNFGDANGTAPDTWISAPYSFDWTVYPYYLYNNTIQIVAFAKDKWGTETPITSILSANAYTLARIIDTEAPDAAISYTWNGLNDPAWVSGLINPNLTINATITSDIMLSDLASVDFKFNGVVIGTVNAPLVNNIAQITWTGLPANAATTSGVLQVVTHDVYGNVNSAATRTLSIDNVLPTANLVFPATIDRGTELVLNANAADAPAGILNVEYAYAQTAVPALPWNAITTVTAAPWTFAWTVPATLEFGATYTVQAKITDLVGNVFTVTRDFTVTDPETPMQILTVAGHTPQNGIIPVRLHDDVTIETAVNDVNIMRVEYVIRASAQAPWTSLGLADVVNGRADIVLSDILPTYAAGAYQLGVRAREARATYGNVAAYVAVTLDHSLTIGQTVSLPANNGFFNGETFTVNFAVTTDDEIDSSSVNLEYRVIGIDGANDWHVPIIATRNLERTGANTYVATFTGVEIYHTSTSLLNGMMDFRFSVSDKAEETPNTTNLVIANVMYDTTDPEVIFTTITGTGVTEIAGNYNIQLASTATVNGNAWDVLYGQINQVASGIDKVELWYNYNGVDVLIGTDTTAPYSFTWNTTGLSVGVYSLGMMAYDKAGNVNGAAQNVTIVPAAGWEPYAQITAMSFDGDNANQDVIYATVDRWNNEVIDQVAFEYLVGTTWTQFAAITNPAPSQFTVHFNAELMSTATKIRTVVTYNGGLISTTKPELSIAYSTAEGGSLTVTAPTINANVFYNNELRITGAASAPRATVMFNGSLVSTPAVQLVNGNQTAFFTVPSHGVYKLWASAMNYSTWQMQLNNTTLNTYNIGTVASNGISTTVPAGSYVYFENVQPSVTLPTGFTGLSAQNAVLANPQGDLDFSVTLTSTPVANRTVVGMYYDGSQWINVPAIVTGNTAAFTAPSGYIYAVAQYTGTDFNVVFSGIEPQYLAGAQLWTVEDPTSIKFFVYDGMTQGGYTSPAVGDITWQMYLDDVAIPSTYVNGYITASASDLAVGTHNVSVVVTMNDVEVTAEKAFNVETTQPVIVAVGTQLTVSNRTISATITDPQTGIMDAHLYMVNPDNPSLNMSVPMENLVINGNTYSYTFTMDDLNALGYAVNYTMPLNVIWYAANPLLPVAVTEPINYTVDIEGPAIAFTGFANGWWLNPTFTTPLTFNVTVPQGRTMPTDGVWIDLDEVTPSGDNHIQYMTLAPTSVAGNVYSYSFNFGQMLSPAATAVKLSVEAMDNYNIYNESEQTYGIDMAAPVVWAMAPVGDPIDNDGDGLFNEDAPNGVNEDLDWVDLDQDGFWDIDEPQIIDEDPIDFQNAIVTQGTNVVVALGFEDYSSFQYLLPGGTTWYYTGQSGINVANIQVSLNGNNVTGTVTNGTFTYNAGVLDAGHYTVVASVPDRVGNVGSLAFEFDVVGGAPTIVFNPIAENGWWINSTEANELTFSVAPWQDLADGGVVANIYVEPANTLIQGPITPTPNQGNYTISLLGGVVPAGQYAVRLEVSATNHWGMTSISNQTYGIDNSAPVITLTNPAEDAQFNINATVNIMASISDQVATRLANQLRSSNDPKDRPAGSGIQSAILTVIAPDGSNAFEPITYPVNTQVISQPMVATMYGTYIINLTAKDNAGNQSMVSRNFMVTPAAAPAVSFTEIAWLNSVGTNNLNFTVNSVVPVSVVANVFTYPADALLMGPLNLNSTTSAYTVALNGAMIPVDQTAVRLQVVVNDQFGNVTEANQYYNVDRIAPEVVIINPAEGLEVTLVDAATAVNILAQFTDASGSGIAGSSLVVLDPQGAQVGAAVTTLADVTETTHNVNNLMLGTYTIRLTVMDKAGNQKVTSVTFKVVAVPAPPVALEISDAYAYPNPMVADGTGKIKLTLTNDAYVNVRIYDFAGREVRSLDYNGKVMAKAAAEIVFDGYNNKGVKLARGTYFARVIANDGKKIVEKVVKIAIK